MQAACLTLPLIRHGLAQWCPVRDVRLRTALSESEGLHSLRKRAASFRLAEVAPCVLASFFQKPEIALNPPWRIRNQKPET
jgi:hypothetical protein